jgi:hypothetical protein
MNMTKSITQSTLALLIVGLTALISFGQEGPTTEAPPKALDKPHDLAWVEKRIQDWQPTKDERRFDQIGWAKDLPEALRLGKEKGRPIFVFTHKGHMQFGRC